MNMRGAKQSVKQPVWWNALCTNEPARMCLTPVWKVCIKPVRLEGNLRKANPWWLGPTNVVRCTMHMWILAQLFDYLQDLCRSFWQDLVEERNNVTPGQGRFVKESMVMPTTCRTITANMSSQCSCRGSVHSCCDQLRSAYTMIEDRRLSRLQCSRLKQGWCSTMKGTAGSPQASACLMLTACEQYPAKSKWKNTHGFPPDLDGNLISALSTTFRCTVEWAWMNIVSMEPACSEKNSCRQIGQLQ